MDQRCHPESNRVLPDWKNPLRRVGKRIFAGRTSRGSVFRFAAPGGGCADGGRRRVRLDTYLAKHPRQRRFFRVYRQFFPVAVLLGSTLIVVGLFAAGCYGLLARGEVTRALVQTGLPLSDAAPEALPAGTGTGISQRMLRHAVFVPQRLSVSYLFESRLRPDGGTDWEDEEGQPLTLPEGSGADAGGDALYQYDPAQIPAGMAGVMPVDLSATGLTVQDATDYRVNLEEYAAAAYPLPSMTGTAQQPAVLILHTHATECYAAKKEPYYDPTSDVTRSTDPEQNMIAVGKELKQTLESRGIYAIHLTEQFDAESYEQAYTLAAKAIRSYTEKYPSISYVIDLHRDSMVRADQTKLRPVTLIGGERAAQIMLVVGTDQAGGDHPAWRDNLCVAAHLQKRMLTAGTAIARPLNLRCATFNEQYTPGSLLVEIGSTGNTLQEAKCAARYFGKILADTILQGNG